MSTPLNGAQAHWMRPGWPPLLLTCFMVEAESAGLRTVARHTRRGTLVGLSVYPSPDTYLDVWNDFIESAKAEQDAYDADPADWRRGWHASRGEGR